MARITRQVNCIVLAAFLFEVPALAGLPERSVNHYSQAFIDGQQVRSTDDVTIVARSDGASEPIGRYHMGDIPAAGDDFVLRLRIESLVEGQQRSDDAVLIGETVSVYVQEAQGAERKVLEFVLSAAGVRQNRTIELITCADNSECDDQNDCTTDACVGDACVFTAVADDTACPDDLFCNGIETCQLGVCSDGPDPCAPPQECDEENDVCEAPLGACCRDGVCEETTEEACIGGACVRDPQWQCDGDVDGDGQVNPVDSGLVQANFCGAGSCSDEQLCRFDIDCDGQLNPVDSGIVQSLFGTCNSLRPTCDVAEWFSGEDCQSIECP